MKLTLLLILIIGIFLPVSAQQVLKPGDVVTLKCIEDDALNGDYTVTDTGLLLLQYIGAVEVKGLTPSAAADKVSKALVSQQILRKATITITLKERNRLPITVTGAVKNPGEFAFVEGIKLSTVLAKAEPNTAADRNAIRITRGSQTIVVTGDPLLQPGDKVFVPLLIAAGEVTVLGSVVKPGTYPHKNGMRLSDALQAAGGLRAGASRTAIEIRHSAGGRKVVALDGTDEVLSPGDQVYVPQAAAEQKVYVRGAIAKPGLIPYSAGLTLSKAVTDASPISGARVDNIKLLRKSPDGKTVTHKANLKKISEGKEQDWALMPGDIVDVPYPSSSYSADSTLKLVGIGLLLWFLLRG